MATVDADRSSRADRDVTSGPPDDAPLAAYAQDAGCYDARTAFFSSCRARIVDALEVAPGDVVLDVGCGTGLCFEGLRDRVGDQGQVIGIDGSPEMAALAQARVARNGWDNVAVLASNAGAAAVPVLADRALFCAVHDVLQDPAGLRSLVEHLRPGAVVAAGGGKFAGGWYAGLNPHVALLHRPYVRSFAGFAAPWAHLAALVPDLRVTEFAMGTGYCAVGLVGTEVSGAAGG